MRLTTSMLAFQLQKRLLLPDRLHFPTDQPVDSICLLSKEPVNPGSLYIVTSPFRQENLRPVAGVSYLFLSSEECPSPPGCNICTLPEPLAGYDWSQTALMVLQAAAQIILEFARWEQAYAKLNAKNAGIREYFGAISLFYDGPLLLVDRNSEVLGGAPQQVAAYFGNSDAQISHEQITDIMLSTDFKTNSQETGFFDVCALTGNKEYLCHNIQKNGTYLGCLALCGRTCANVDPGELSIIQCILNLLEPPMFTHIDLSYALSKNAEIHTLLSNILQNPQKAPSACRELADLLVSYGWRGNEPLCVICLRFFDGISIAASGSYVCNVLEEQWCHSFAVVSGSCIYWVINCGKHGIGEFGDAFQKLIVTTVSSYICQAGVSYFFENIHHLNAYIRQAETALELGQKRAPYHWYHLYGSYVLEDVSSQITRYYTPQQIAHRGLLKLIAHDRVHKSQYVKALYTFLACDRNVSRAAEALFLHRSSLTRQLERIRAIMELPEEETFEQDLYLRLSLYLLNQTPALLP